MTEPKTLMVNDVLYIQANATKAAEPVDGLPYCIVRCRDAGVHAGYVVRQEGRTVELRRARRLWQYRVTRAGDGKAGHCSEIATHGIIPSKSRVGCEVDMKVMDACEMIPATAAAARTIQEAQDG